MDTSVWVRFLADKEPYASELESLLDRDEVSGHELHQATLVPHEEVVAFVRARCLQGRGAVWIDIQLLAAAVVGNLQLWTADKSCAALAEGLGVAYHV